MSSFPASALGAHLEKIVDDSSFSVPEVAIPTHPEASFNDTSEALEYVCRFAVEQALRGEGVPEIDLEGPPGVGKTTFARLLSERLAARHYPTLTTPADWFMRCAHDPKLQAWMVRSPNNFNRGYCDDQRAADFMDEVRYAPSGSQHNPGKIYDRDLKARAPGPTLGIPDKPWVMLADGAGISRINAQRQLARGSRARLTILLYTQQASLLRDVLRYRSLVKGRALTPEREVFLDSDLALVIGERINPNIGREKRVVTFDNTDALNALMQKPLPDGSGFVSRAA